MTNILYLDIETAPMRVDSWGLFNQNFGLSQIREDPRVLCFAAKWRDDKAVRFYSEWDNGRETMLAEAHSLLTQANVVAHYNGARFDVPWLNGEFARQGWGPPAPYQQLDFMKVARKIFRFPSGKLQYLAEALGVGSKLQHEGHGLWVKVMQGDVRAQAKMKRYNIQDTVLLEKLHDRIMPWITGVNMRAFVTGRDACTNCQSEALVKEGFSYTASGARYQRYHCRDCGTWCRSTKRLDGTDITGVA